MVDYDEERSIHEIRNSKPAMIMRIEILSTDSFTRVTAPARTQSTRLSGGRGLSAGVRGRRSTSGGDHSRSWETYGGRRSGGDPEKSSPATSRWTAARAPCPTER